MKNVCNFDLIFDFLMLKKNIYIKFLRLCKKRKKEKKSKSIFVCICLKRGNS